MQLWTDTGTGSSLPPLLLPPLLQLLQALRSNSIGTRGAQALAKGLTALTCLDLANCPVGRRATKQLAHLLPPADGNALADLDSRCW